VPGDARVHSPCDRPHALPGDCACIEFDRGARSGTRGGRLRAEVSPTTCAGTRQIESKEHVVRVEERRQRARRSEAAISVVVEVKSDEFDLEQRSEVEVLRTNVADSQDQLRRARVRLERAERRVRNLEVAVESWSLLLAQYERALDHRPDVAARDEIRLP
jgi:hypothetical protein